MSIGKWMNKHQAFCLFVLYAFLALGLSRFFYIITINSNAYSGCIDYTADLWQVYRIEREDDDTEIMLERIYPNLWTVGFKIWSWNARDLAADKEMYDVAMAAYYADEREDARKYAEASATFDERYKKWQEEIEKKDRSPTWEIEIDTKESKE